MTEQERAAALADVVGGATDVHTLIDGGFPLYFNKAEWQSIEAALRLLAATPAASSVVPDEMVEAAATAVRNARNPYITPWTEGADYDRRLARAALEAALKVKEAPAASSEVRERVAREIYAAFPFDEATGSKPAWVERGNSIRQDDARRCATRILDLALSAIRPGDRLPAGVVVPEEPTEAMVSAVAGSLLELSLTADFARYAAPSAAKDSA